MRSAIGALVVLLAACTPTTATTTSPAGVTSSSIAPSSSTSAPGSTPSTTTPTTTITSTTAPTMLTYAVVAMEQGRALAVIDPTGPGALLGTISLVERPHNLAAMGGLVFATHPSAGSISRVDVASGAVTSVPVGVEPHDVKAGPDTLWVTDEAGREVLELDPGSLRVVQRHAMPAQPHDLYVAEDVVWVTLVGSSRLARIAQGAVTLVEVGGAPHDLVVDAAVRIWFSNWGSPRLDIYRPAAGTTEIAPAGVREPHHFALGPDGSVWVSDNGGDSVVAFTGDVATPVTVGPTPHHLVFAGRTLVVAVSGSGDAVLVRDGRVAGTVPLGTGLHGVAIVRTERPVEGGP